MAETSTIEWTDATWQIVTGCSLESPGCTNCYAMKLAGTRLQHHPSREGLTVPSKAGPVWNGKVRFNEEWLLQPMLWTRGRNIFVAAHGDLFHPEVADEVLDQVFAVMAASPQHTFQVLTKRSARARAYLTAPDVVARIIAALEALAEIIGPGKNSRDPKGGAGWNAWAAAENLKLGNVQSSWPLWPLKNLWLGVSAEDQRRADERVPDLLATPAAVRFVSAEPLLGPISFFDLLSEPGRRVDALRSGLAWLQTEEGWLGGADCHPALDWMIVGGESGPNARPMHPAWARSIRDQCAAAGVAFHFKQHGAWAAIDQSAGADEAGWQGRGDWMILSADGDLDIPDDRWPDEAAGEVAVVRVGKKTAGRLLDGVEHNGMPEVRI
ncbi:Gp37Gp68 family protein [Methylorubrum populi]|uniref:Gp37Gp68 family protein n=1 Tax=Methylorubrum populi TaxID=223967 RepID=A0A160PFA6_9HYPH|nr:phage Gp37/Gp68 family protein [Methylorubrum populi]BAU91215.1 Gp37Gp68 family protein [Methylorubrum populi]